MLGPAVEEVGQGSNYWWLALGEKACKDWYIHT